MNFLFPFAEVEKKSRIILYGAGAVGYQFYCQLQTTGFCEIVKWVDGQYEWYRSCGMPVDSPMSFLDSEYDIVVIAVEKEFVCELIKKNLENMGVNQKKIYWSANYQVKEIKLKKNNYNTEVEKAELVECYALLNEKRMDIVIRYIYAKAFLKKENEKYAERLYRKMICAVNGAEEPLTNCVHAYFSDYSQKKGLNEFEQAFKNLILSMKEKGFLRERFIPIGADGELINGAHRLAAACALGIKVWVVKYEQLKGRMLSFDFTQDWMRKSGFEEEDIIYVKKICEDCKQKN